MICERPLKHIYIDKQLQIYTYILVMYKMSSCFAFRCRSTMSRMMQPTSTSELKEAQPLLRQDADRLQRKNRICRECCPIRYRFIAITGNGAIFMIVLNMFFLVGNLSCLEHTKPETLPSNPLWTIIPTAFGLMSCRLLGC